jgi:hypothetical protein
MGSNPPYNVWNNIEMSFSSGKVKTKHFGANIYA